MKRIYSTLLALALPVLATTLLTSAAQACVGVGQIKIAVKTDGAGTGKALVSEYDCTMMVAKTNCVLGVRLSDAALADSKVAIRQVRFVSLKDGSQYQGFLPAANQRTTAAWGRVMDGSWYGFSAVYTGAGPGKNAGLAIEITFSYDPAVGDQQILQAFNMGHVGLAEGDSQGGIARGHMLEVIQIQRATLAQL
jgi:hypothetical protein